MYRRPGRPKDEAGMNAATPGYLRHRLRLLSVGLGILPSVVLAQTSAMPAAVLLEKSRIVETARAGQAAWEPAQTNQVLQANDRVRTGERSRATVQLSDRSLIRLGELSALQITSPDAATKKLEVPKGIFYFFHRDKPGAFDLKMPGCSAGVRGTEFVIYVAEDGTSRIELLDGEVEMANEFGPPLYLRSGEAGEARPGRAPVRTAAIEARQVIQWWLYYPAVLDSEELNFSKEEAPALEPSLADYRKGDLLAALDKYPAGRQPQSDAERTYFSALLLSVGQVAAAEAQLRAVQSSGAGLAGALRRLVATVKGDPLPVAGPFQTATEWMAESYRLQSQFKLAAALGAARNATRQSPGFGFAWARVAELEFSFGRNGESLTALAKGLQLSPRSAQAQALQGFLLTAQGRYAEARAALDHAIAIDGALGNAWLGRGLLKMRQGDIESGREDLQTAAVLEPNRSLLRSYLGKAYTRAFDDPRAAHELELARKLDPDDPTPWLYSALLKRQMFQFNDAIEDLERSQELNDNRRLYRSRLLLDQDNAVRSVGLAAIYEENGMTDVARREAARAVNHDYASYSAHQFLSDSYNALRDPTRFNLRNETVWFNELLLANLLAPVGAGRLSQQVSQQEYARLFESDRLGLTSTTEYRSDGQVRELASQFGTFGRVSYSLDVDYQHNDGVRSNNDLSRLEWYSTIKLQLSPRDSALLIAKYQDYDSGDNFQYYDPERSLRRDFRFTEKQEPWVVAGYHHEWAPGVHTLALGGRLMNEQSVTDRGAAQFVVVTNAAGLPLQVGSLGFDTDYDAEFAIYTGELQQVFQSPDRRHTIVVGGRFQGGTYRTSNTLTLTNGSPFAFLFGAPAAEDTFEEDFERLSGYGYYTLSPVPSLQLTAGLSYDHLTFPQNHRNPPISPGTETREHFGPKAAVVWAPRREISVRGIYSRALGGVSFDESFRLEPTQLAGFAQGFRTIISESVAGSVSAPEFEIAGAAIDLKLPTGTYFSVQAEYLNSDVDRTVGIFAAEGPFLTAFSPGSMPERLDYRERSVTAVVNQILSREWSLGAQYKFTRSELDDVFTAIPVAVVPDADRSLRADLHSVNLYAVFNHRSGFFARAETQWFSQENSGYSTPLPGDDFWQHNVYVGYRFPRLRGEVTLGLLNLTSQDYRLNPLNAYVELPRERAFFARLRLNF
jgi:tetratricopeptide (TPR) repeat protein